MAVVVADPGRAAARRAPPDPRPQAEPHGHSETRPDIGRVILRNSLVTTAGSVVMRVLNFLFTVFTVRLLGESGFGQYSTILAFVSVFGVFFELGMSQYVQRAIAQDRSRAQGLFWNLVVLRLILAVLGMIAIPALAMTLGYEPLVVQGVLLFTGTFALAALLMPLTTVLTARERFDLSTAVQVVGQVLNLGVGLAFLLLGQGTLGLLYTGYVVMPVQVALCVWAIRRFRLGRLPFRVAVAGWPAFLRASLPFGLTSLALTYNYNIDTVILGLTHTAADVGWYQAAYRLVFNITGLLGGFLVSITPSLAREYQSDPDRVHAWSRSTIQWMALVALPATAGISLLAVPLVGALYGAPYAPAALVLALICWDIPLMMFNALCGNVTAATGLERPAARIYLVSTGWNIVLNLVLIPPFGMLAAAAVTILTDGLTAVRFFHLLSGHLDLRSLLPGLARIVLATALMGGAVWLTSGLPLLVPVAVGVAVYGVLAVTLRLADWQQVLVPARRLLRGRGPAWGRA